MKRQTVFFLTLAGMVLAGCAQQKKVEQVSVAPPPVGLGAQGAVIAAEPQSAAPAPVVAAMEPSPAKASVRVEEAMFCTGVKDRNPQGAGETFDVSVKKVFFFTRIQGAKTPTTITHVWYWNEKKMAEVPLDVRSENWRTWSSKRIDPSWKGHWAVKVLDGNGDLVLAKDFQIR